MRQKIVGNLNNALFSLAVVLLIGCFMGTEVEKANAAEPTGFTSQTYEDNDGDGIVDQVVVVVDGDEVLTSCSVTDAEVGTDWAYTGGDIGGALASSGDTHSCDLDSRTITLKITGANENTTGHTTAPTIAYDNDDADDFIANASGSLGAVTAADVTDGAAPIAISAVYKDTDADASGIIDRVDVTFSENIGSSAFVEEEWSFSSNPHSLIILPDDSGISSTDVLIAVTSTVTTINDTTVKYTVATGTTGGITDGYNYAAGFELSVAPVATEGDEDDEEDDEDITPPDDSLPGPATPNYHSGVTLYRMEGDPRVYVIKNKKKHWIKTQKEFEDCGYKWEEIQEIAAQILEEYPEAETLVSDLLRAIGDYRVYKIKEGKKQWIKTIEEFNAAGYNWSEIQEVSPETLAAYQSAISSDLLRAAGDYKVFKIKGGKKHWIRTMEEFMAAGYDWEDVEEVDTQSLEDYPDSEE